MYKVYIQRLERVQNKFLKTLAFKNSLIVNYELLRKRFKILSLENDRALNDILFLYKVVNAKIYSMGLSSLVLVTVPQRPLGLTRTFMVPFSHTNSSVNSLLSRMSGLANIFGGTNLDLFYNYFIKKKD